MIGLYRIKSLSIGSVQLDTERKPFRYFGHMKASFEDKVVSADFYVNDDQMPEGNNFVIIANSCRANFEADKSTLDNFVSEIFDHCGWKFDAKFKIRDFKNGVPFSNQSNPDCDISDALTAMKLSAISLSGTKTGESMSRFCDKVFKEISDHKNNDGSYDF